jgi:hypothetical protein
MLCGASFPRASRTSSSPPTASWDTSGHLGAITFFDTTNQDLNAGSYVLRERREIESSEKDAECALVVWYDAARQPDTPVAVELLQVRQQERRLRRCDGRAGLPHPQSAADGTPELGRSRFPHHDGLRLWIGDPRPFTFAGRSVVRTWQKEGTIWRSAGRDADAPGSTNALLFRTRRAFRSAPLSAIVDPLFGRAHGLLNPGIRIGLRLPQGRGGAFRDVITD